MRVACADRTNNMLHAPYCIRGEGYKMKVDRETNARDEKFVE